MVCPSLVQSFPRRSGWCGLILGLYLLATGARCEDPTPFEGRPLLHLLDNLPVAYILAPGKFEFTHDLMILNDLTDLFGVKAPIVPPFDAGPGSAGAPNGGRGNRLRFQTSILPRVNFFWETGRDALSYPLKGMGLSHQETGLKIGLMNETPARPALTVNLQHRYTSGPSGLESSDRMLEFVASKSVFHDLFIHVLAGFGYLKVVSEDPSGPPPQLRGALPLSPSRQKEFHLGVALTYHLGHRSDLTVGYLHRQFDRPFDGLIPGNGITAFDSAFAAVATRISPSFVANLRVSRESNQMGGLYPFLYNPASAASFGRQFGWIEYGFTWKGDIKPFL